MALIERVLDGLQERRDNVLEGNINSIPSPFTRFRKDYIGIEQSQCVLITAGTKMGKTQLGSYLYIYNPLLYAYYHPDQLSVNILYFPLEESPERVTQRFMSYLLFTMSNGRTIVSPSDLRSTSNDYPIDQDIIDTLHSEEYFNILKFFEKHVMFIEDKNTPIDIYKTCLDFAKSRGTIHTKKVKYGNGEVYDQFDYFELDNPKEYNIVFLDHISLVTPNKGQLLKQAIDEISHDFAKKLRNRYHFTTVILQQQGSETDSLEAQKMSKLMPTRAGLSDSKDTSKDVNIMLGIFSPYKFELPSFHGYDITKFKDRIRFMNVIVNRDGGQGGICPLFFLGESCVFKELPLPGTPELESWYNYLKTLD